MEGMVVVGYISSGKGVVGGDVELDEVRGTEGVCGIAELGRRGPG
jgi:hypothetical protein